jgi:predicted  nucleic acid-binding Zn-ribbon protein
LSFWLAIFPISHLWNQNPFFPQADILHEKTTEKAKFENEKKELQNELAHIQDQLNKALPEKAHTETLQKAIAKLDSEKLRLTDELRCCRTDLEAARNASEANKTQLHRMEADLRQAREMMQLQSTLADDTRKERDELDTKVSCNSMPPEAPVASSFSELKT